MKCNNTYIIVTEQKQIDMNKLRKKLGLEEKPIVAEYKLPLMIK